VKTLRIIAAAAVVAVVALAGPPAEAKGPRSATIDGPGIDAPIEHQAGGLSKLPDLAGIYGPLWDDSMVTLLDEPPTDDLGPGYEIAWDLGTYYEVGELSGGPDLVRQTVYPYAAGSPVVHTEAGQPFYAEETAGGWFVAHPALRDLLVDLGVPARPEVEEPAGAEMAPADDGGWVFPTVLAAVALAAAAVTSVGLLRRRTTVPAADAV
jgi:hypothetical protein